MRVAVHARLRNGVLFRYRQERGLTAAAACRELELCPSDWSAIESMRFDLVSWKRVKVVAEALGVLPEELCPLELARKNCKYERHAYTEIPPDRLLPLSAAMSLPAPEDTEDQADLSLQLSEALEKLTQRERIVVEDRYGIGRDRALTLREAAKKHGVTRERARQIEAKAIRRMKMVLINPDALAPRGGATP